MSNYGLIIFSEKIRSKLAVAVIWQKYIKGTRYEIRKAGNSTRLYTDGVFHSQHNPKHALTRSVWDLLMLPAFFYPPDTIRRVLVLGVGGGTVLHLLQQYIKPRAITGIELNPVHLKLARRFFGLKKFPARLIEADAIAWMQKYQGPPFDMIIDDLFGEEKGEGVRAAPLNKDWFTLLNKNLTNNGLLVFNLLNRKPLNKSAFIHDPDIQRKFQDAYTLSVPQLHNIVAVFLRQASSPGLLRKHMQTDPQLNSLKGPDKLAFRLQKIPARR